MWYIALLSFSVWELNVILAATLALIWTGNGNVTDLATGGGGDDDWRDDCRDGPQAHGESLGKQALGQATVVASPVVHGQATVVASHVVHAPKSDFRDRDDSKQQGQISQKCVLGGVSVCTR